MQEIKEDQTKIIQDMYDLKKFVLEAQQKQHKEVIDPNWKLAKLTEKQKEFIVESLVMAHYGRNMFNKVAESNRWHWEDKTRTWTKKKITENESAMIKLTAEACFAGYMTRVVGIVNTEINKPDNDMLQGILGILPKERMVETEEQPGAAALAKEIIKPREEEK